MPRLALSRTALSLALALLAALVLIGINETGYHRSRAALADIAEASRNRGTLNRMLQQVLDAETGSRGYLLTGDPRYLEPYSAAAADIGQNLDALRAAYPPGSQESASVARLSRDVQRKLAEMDLSVRMRKQGNEDAWKFVLLTDVGKEHMDAIRTQAAGLIHTATERMEVSQTQVHRSLLLARIGIAGVALAGLLAFYLYLRQSQALRRADERQQRVLQQERDLLERQVRDRTASLAELATHLQQVREQERGHLARELHDELGALLTAAKLDVARLKSRLGSPPPEVSQRLQHLTETLNSGIALKRRIIEDLRPSSLANLGLSASLEILAREFSEQSGVEVATSLEPVQLDEARQLTVYRLVQESLTNIAKYAEARQVEISVHGYGQTVEVAVKDDGKGFDLERMRPSTHGLAGMRHRVEAAGGRFTVASAPGQGTRVSAALPQEPGA
ncbi:CHASE3 domain-containing protein [Ramlibacter tataouinensis]|uniref:Candidate histidine kinase, classic n=1 Tax=Ramlibacter tataouinensis (strain ATCC BAA-407 / DSM 14655 / LMG 21543 / TTB310) TaxID=365046 RepID=F5XWQ1_RAMTT|nr:CHASE3 domain-containing protein [Ramlibacter tataouinensis]AEG94195.1 candidate histidine kinase, classic [Ramlibacter tataouinensis TTB310]